MRTGGDERDDGNISLVTLGFGRGGMFVFRMQKCRKKRYRSPHVFCCGKFAELFGGFMIAPAA